MRYNNIALSWDIIGCGFFMGVLSRRGWLATFWRCFLMSAFFRYAAEYGKRSLIVFHGASLSVLLMHSCIRLGSGFRFFLAFGFLK